MQQSGTFVTAVAPLRELISLVSTYLRQFGFDWRAERGGRDANYGWLRPPLFTQLVLGQRPLQPYLAVRCEAGIDQFVDVYERFIAGYLRTRTYHDFNAARWFERELGMVNREALTVFVPQRAGQLRRDLHMNLVQFAALVSYNVECWFEEGADTFVVTSVRDNFQFGVRGGRWVSNWGGNAKSIPVRFMRSETGYLHDAARGEETVRGVPSLLDSARYWVHVRRGEIGEDAPALQLALRALWWRLGYIPTRLRAMTLRESGSEALRNAIRLARGYRQFENPLNGLHDIFVPQFFTGRQFSRKFGNPGSLVNVMPSARTQERWNGVLDELESEAAPVQQ